MEDIAQELLNWNGYDDWTVEDDAVLIDPDGNRVEWDHPSSPLRKLGLI